MRIRTAASMLILFTVVGIALVAIALGVPGPVVP